MKKTGKFFKSLFSAILWAIFAIFSPDAAGAERGARIENDPNAATRSDAVLYFGLDLAAAADAAGLGDEFATIAMAAIRNGCRGDDFIILLAVRKAEDGRPGREFGIFHPRCQKQMIKRPDETLDIQAGWAAATIVKNRTRWTLAGRPDGFIRYLADRYCPKETDPAGNENFKANVTYWTAKIRGIANTAPNKAVSGQLSAKNKTASS